MILKVKIFFYYILLNTVVSAQLYATSLHGSDKRIIGLYPIISIPQLHIYNARAKTDTGAYSSSIHCSSIRVDEDEKWVHFTPLKSQKSYRLPLVALKKVKSSNGVSEERPFVRLKIIVENETIMTSFSLTHRSGMKNAILLGRKLLQNKFLVDVTQ